MRSILGVLATVATHDVSVLFRGESGSGKSVLARALHAASPRRVHPFVSMDCRGLHREALFSAHVVHEKITEAGAGTILLDEIGALPKQLQATIARLLVAHHLDRLAPGVRVVATSQRDLEAAVRTGGFSEDLLSRLAVVEVRVPPLRDRREDIVPLARRFLHDFTVGRELPLELTERAERALLAHRWDGNVRELRNAIHHAVILSPGTTLDLEALPPKLWTRS